LEESGTGVDVKDVEVRVILIGEDKVEAARDEKERGQRAVV
jgi:hypothetical protein